jgi:1-deoxy-D-xylulose-5-phosphate synthase
MPEKGEVLKIGKGRIIREGSSIAILSLGGRMQESLKAADELAVMGYSTTVADARFAKPLDQNLIRTLATSHELLITIEEGSPGGFGAHVVSFMAGEGLLDSNIKVRVMTLPDMLIAHDTPDKQYEEARLDAPAIIDVALMALGSKSKVVRA